MKILYIAYSCDPFNGSENQIGWNIPFESAKSGNEVYVITKVGHKESIESYFNKYNNKYNIKFYYVDIDKFSKKIFNGFLYSGRLISWNRRAFKVAKEVCDEFKVEIIHQITPIELRSIGNYGNIKNIKFIVGPIGGGSRIPNFLKSYSRSHNFFEFTKWFFNIFTKYIFIFGRKMKKIDKVLFSNEETRDIFGKLNNYDIITELGIKEENINKFYRKTNNVDTTFLVCGRLIYIKGQSLLFDALEKLDDKFNYLVRVVGAGPDYELLSNRINSSPKLSSHVKLIGQVDFNEMNEEYDKCDVLIMPSIRENTGTVIIEAFSRGKPVVAMDKFGAKLLVNDSNGWLYFGKNKEELISNLKNIIEECINNKSVLINKGINALKSSRKYTWKKRIEYFNNIYKEIKGD